MVAENEKEKKKKELKKQQEQAYKRWKRSLDKHKNGIKFGLSKYEYNHLLSKQDKRCGICRKSQSRMKKALAVDHCHETGLIRGFLCSSCNLGLGCFRDNVDYLREAIVYLRKAERTIEDGIAKYVKKESDQNDE